VLCEKTFAGPHAADGISAERGRGRASEKYLDHMDVLIKAMRKR
jgi:hypothetical protein